MLPDMWWRICAQSLMRVPKKETAELMLQGFQITCTPSSRCFISRSTVKLPERVACPSSDCSQQLECKHLFQAAIALELTARIHIIKKICTDLTGIILAHRIILPQPVRHSSFQGGRDINLFFLLQL